MSVYSEIAIERARQIEKEGFSIEHDDEHIDGQLADAAACYAKQAAFLEATGVTPVKHYVPKDWPWDHKWYKHSDPRRMLVKAAALIVAEIERLDRK